MSTSSIAIVVMSPAAVARRRRAAARRVGRGSCRGRLEEVAQLPGTVHRAAGDPPGHVRVHADGHRAPSSVAELCPPRGGVRTSRRYPIDRIRMYPSGRGRRAARRHGDATATGASTGVSANRSSDLATTGGSVRLWFVTTAIAIRSVGSQRTTGRKPSSRPEWPSVGWPSNVIGLDTEAVREAGRLRGGRATSPTMAATRVVGSRTLAAVERARPSGRGPRASRRSNRPRRRR